MARFLSTEEGFQVLRRLRNGERKRALSQELGVCRKTLNAIDLGSWAGFRNVREPQRLQDAEDDGRHTDLQLADEERERYEQVRLANRLRTPTRYGRWTGVNEKLQALVTIQQQWGASVKG